jgi:hypothetical protein
MVYKLAISPRYTYSDLLSEYVLPWEFPRSTLVDFYFDIMNIGDTKFNGSLTLLEATFGNIPLGSTSSTIQNLNISIEFPSTAANKTILSVTTKDVLRRASMAHSSF